MTKLFTLISLFAFGAGSQPAWAENPLLPSANLGARLDELFENGSLPAEADVLGWHLGRCLGVDDKIYSAVSNGRRVATEAGSVTPTELKYAGFQMAESPETFFDSLDPSYFAGDAAELADWFRYQSPVLALNGSLVTYDVRNPLNASRLRKNGNYLIVKNDHPEFVRSCYLFKKW